MRALEITRLPTLMARTDGRADLLVALIDGPVLTTHPELEPRGLQTLGQSAAANCQRPDSPACVHGTFVAGVLHARRGGKAPGLCPGCRLLVRPIFSEQADGGMPACDAQDLARAIVDCVQAGARLLNLSLGLGHASASALRELGDALDLAARKGALMVVAAGNQSAIGGSLLTRHAAVIPVAACALNGRIAALSNLGFAIGRRGLAAPGEDVESLSPGGGTRSFSGTSAAAPFVTGAAALLWSLFPRASAHHIRHALLHSPAQARTSIVPPLLDAQSAWDSLRSS